MKNILITGSDGFIGSNLISELEKKKKYFLFALTKKRKKDKPKVKFINKQISGNLDEVFKKVDLIIHCASKGVYGKGTQKEIFKTNYSESLKFFDKAFKNGCKNWIILGSSAEYGYIKNKSLSAINTKPNPVNAYGKSKVLFLNNLKKKSYIKNCKVLYLRIFHVYGKNEPSGRLYTDLIKAIRDSRDFEMSSGKEYRDFINVDDVCKMIIKSFSIFQNKNFFIIKHIGSGKKIKVKVFVKNILKKYPNSKIKILFNKVKDKNIYHSMYSDQKSILR